MPIIAPSTNRFSSFRMRIVLSLLLAAIVGVIALPPSSTSAQSGRSVTQEAVSAQRATADETIRPDEDAPGFIINAANGQQVCQQSTPEEVRLLQRRDPSVELHQITPSQRHTSSRQQTGLKIILRGTPQLEAFPEAKNAFLLAAAQWESLIATPMTIVIDVDFGPNKFGVPYPRPNIIGQTSLQSLVTTSIVGVRDVLITRAATQAEADFYRTLPATTVPTDLGTTSRLTSPSALFRAVGLIAQVANPDAEMANLGAPPNIGFNSSFTYDFDPTDGIDQQKIDFVGTALHEIGHALGFSSNVGARELTSAEGLQPPQLAVTIWDLFRFRPTVTAGTFMTADRILSSGGEHVFFSARNQPLPLSTGRPDATGGDERQASHWKDDILLGGFNNRIGIMDPTLPSGRLITITNADLNALATMGYRLEPAGNQGAVIELAHDDGTLETGQINTNGRIVVNRFTPSEYPITLRKIRIYFTILGNSTTTFDPSGAQIRLVAFTGPSGTSLPPNAPTLIADQMVTVPEILTGNFIDFDITNLPQIAAGDLYVGFQVPNPAAGISVPNDSNGDQKMRSFISDNNGQTYQGPYTSGTPATPRNFMIRAVVGRGNPQVPGTLAIVSAASFQGGKVAPESIAAAFGGNLATGIESASTVPLPTIIRRTTLTVRDAAGTTRSGSLFFVSPNQINFLIPAGTVNGLATVTVTSGDGQISAGTIQVGASAPAIFAANSNGSGPPAAYLLRAKNSGQQIEEQILQFNAGQGGFVALPIDLTPTDEVAFLIIYGTGLRGRTNLGGVSVTIGGTPITVAYAGQAGGFIGLDQINAGPLPRNLAGRGEVDLVVTVDGQTTNLTKIRFK